MYVSQKRRLNVIVFDCEMVCKAMRRWRVAVVQWSARQTYNHWILVGLSTNPSKCSCSLLEQETKPSLLSTGCFQEWKINVKTYAVACMQYSYNSAKTKNNKVLCLFSQSCGWLIAHLFNLTFKILVIGTWNIDVI